jgi:hypothetical protein
VCGDDGVGVAGQKIFAFADADDERRTAPRADDFVGLVGANHREAVSADDFAQRVADGLGVNSFPISDFRFPILRFLIIIADQMRQHFGVGVGFKSVPGGEQSLSLSAS